LTDGSLLVTSLSRVAHHRFATVTTLKTLKTVVRTGQKTACQPHYRSVGIPVLTSVILLRYHTHTNSIMSTPTNTNVKNRIQTFRMSPNEQQALKDYAAQQGVTTSAFLRQALVTVLSSSQKKSTTDLFK